MFEEYLEDSRHFFDAAESASDDSEARRNYRVSIILAMSALEAFVNYLADTFSKSTKYPQYEVAFLNDMKFGIIENRFDILNQFEFHRLDDKLRFMLKKYVPKFDFEHSPFWSQFLQFKKLRDSITHPRSDEDTTSISQYSKQVKYGLDSVISLIDILCKGVFGRPLRKHIKDLIPN